MIAPTHITFAEFIYLLILTTTGIALSPINTIAIGVASLLPDIDTEASRVGRVVPFLSRRIEKRFGHRTLTHSLLFILLIATVSLPILFIDIDLYVCLLVGYASHPFLDTMTINGVRLFYPFSDLKCVFPLEVNQPHRYRVQSGSKVDATLAIIFLIGCIPTFFIAHQGYERFVRFTQRSIESAVRDYNEFSRTHSVFAEIVAHDLLTKEQLNGTFEILGALDDHTLLFKGKDRKPHTVGKEYHAEFVAEDVLCFKDVPVTTSIRTIEMANQTLGLLVNYVQPDRGTLFFGTVRTKDKVALPPDDREFSPLKGTATHLVCNYASLDDIEQLGLNNILVEQGTLIARSLVPVRNRDSAFTHVRSPFTEVSFLATTAYRVRFVARIGDTVACGRTLATVALAAPIEAEIQLHHEQIQSLKNELVQKLLELHVKTEKKAREVRRDSVTAQKQNELREKGFSKQGGSIQTVQSSERGLQALQSSEALVREKYALKIQKHNTDILRLQAKQNALPRGESVLRSTVDGVVYDIRQKAEGTKRRITFIIKANAQTKED
jgi:inner membrane protein